MRSDRTYLLCLDFERATITRYIHHRGTWGARHLRTVAVEPPEAMREMGAEDARRMIEDFRLRGDVT